MAVAGAGPSATVFWQAPACTVAAPAQLSAKVALAGVGGTKLVPAPGVVVLPKTSRGECKASQSVCALAGERLKRAAALQGFVLPGAVPGAPPPKAAAAPSSTAEAAVAQAAGSVSVVAGRSFKRLRPLGHGAFGEVWEAQECDSRGSECRGPVVALKCSRPQGKDTWEACVLEAEVLQQLDAVLPAGVVDGASSSTSRVPRYVAHSQALKYSDGENQVLIAMSKLEGRPLDQWLYGVDETCMKTLAVSTLLDGPLPDGRLGSRDLTSASACAEALLCQIAPVFAVLEPIAYHRDVSGHNFLIHEREGACAADREQFSILDFGLAVRSSSWRQEWRRRNIAGDPRYFAPSAWMLLTYGHRHLDEQPDKHFARQYEHRIDHFSLGVLVVEVFFALWQGPAVEASLEQSPQRLAALLAARAAWRTYWSRVVGLFQMFHVDGAMVLRQSIVRTNAIQRLVSELRVLCTALRTAAAASEGCAEARILRAAGDLLDWRGSLSWEDVSALLRPVQDAAPLPAPAAAAKPPAPAEAESAPAPARSAADRPVARACTPQRLARAPSPASPPRPRKEAPPAGLPHATPRALFQSPTNPTPVPVPVGMPDPAGKAEACAQTSQASETDGEDTEEGEATLHLCTPPRRRFLSSDEANDDSFKKTCNNLMDAFKKAADTIGPASAHGAEEQAHRTRDAFKKANAAIQHASLTGAAAEEPSRHTQDVTCLALWALKKAAAAICTSALPLPRRAATLPAQHEGLKGGSTATSCRASRYGHLQAAVAAAAAVAGNPLHVGGDRRAAA